MRNELWEPSYWHWLVLYSQNTRKSIAVTSIDLISWHSSNLNGQNFAHRRVPEEGA